MEPIPSTTTTVSVNPQMEFLRLFISLHNVLLEQMNGHIRELDLTISQVNVLVSIASHRGEGVSQREIERELYLSNPTVTGILQRLEAKGYLSSEPSTEDRRCKQILVTKRALEANQQVLDHLAASEQRLVSDMSRAEIIQLQSFLDRMIQNLSASNGAPQSADQFPRFADEMERKREDRGCQSPDFR